MRQQHKVCGVNSQISANYSKSIERVTVFSKRRSSFSWRSQCSDFLNPGVNLCFKFSAQFSKLQRVPDPWLFVNMLTLRGFRLFPWLICMYITCVYHLLHCKVSVTYYQYIFILLLLFLYSIEKSLWIFCALQVPKREHNQTSNDQCTYNFYSKTIMTL